MLLLITLYLALVILLPLGLSGLVSYRTLPRGTTCPLCRGETLWVRQRWLAVFGKLRIGSPLQRRWCPACCWEGLTRGERLATHQWSWTEPTQVETAEPEWRAPVAESEREPVPIRVRRLLVDGRTWSVMLQCWHASEGWYGRLLFLGPSGQRCTDMAALLDGSSPDDLIGQARALPEGMLAGKLRDLIAD